jgi:hypothetical protein
MIRISFPVLGFRANILLRFSAATLGLAAEAIALRRLKPLALITYRMDAITLKLRCDPDMAARMNMNRFITRGPNQRKPCWDDSDNIAMIDTVTRQWKCAPIYIIRQSEKKIDDVFDGAHRCEAVFKFIDNVFKIEKVSSVDWDTSPLRDFVGKQFGDLPADLQDVIKNYKFDINVIDQETANNPAALKLLWTRLSKAGKPLNNFETMIPIHSHLNKYVLETHLSSWYKTLFFNNDRSERGQLEVKLKRLLCLSHYEILPQFSSLEDLIKKWNDDVLGKTTDEINKKSKEYTEEFNKRLTHIRKLFTELEDRNVLREGTTSLIDKSKEVPLLIILGRLAYWFKTIADFKRGVSELCAEIKGVISKDPNDLCKLLGVNSRNATFQKQLIKYLDEKFRVIAEKHSDVRLFTSAQKKKKLEEQGFKCVACNEPILEHQRNDGHHIISRCKGGRTDYENLEVLHKHCHENQHHAD